MFVNARQFAEDTGYPLRMVKRMLAEGEIPNERSGRRYCFSKEDALAAIRNKHLESARLQEEKGRRNAAPKGGSAKERVARLLGKAYQERRERTCRNGAKTFTEAAGSVQV
ncbi:MAG: hypothetical protein LBO03_04400 [Acidaminococcales bacterium]|jgi:excisionase family DNA binding protein|nr:hypothetical protein [Acidaminococcales bacterium]